MDNIEDLGELNIGKGTIKMGGHHKKEPVLRSFDSPEEMAKHAEEVYQVGVQRENKQEIEAGFDVRNRESVLAFDIGYVPRNGGVIIKEIPKDIVPEEKGITLIELGDEMIRWWVIAVGNLVVDLKKGDVVHTTGGAQGVKRRFKKVLFWEMESYSISGIYTTAEEMERRIKEHDNKINNRNNMLGGIVLTSSKKEKKDEDKSNEELEEDLEKARQEAREATREAFKRKAGEEDEDEKQPDKKEE